MPELCAVADGGRAEAGFDGAGMKAAKDYEGREEQRQKRCEEQKHEGHEDRNVFVPFVSCDSLSGLSRAGRSSRRGP